MATMHKICYGHYHIIPYVNYSCTVIGKGCPGPTFAILHLDACASSVTFSLVFVAKQLKI
jgi:hypothetical protein